jgi:hypothetical protein
VPAGRRSLACASEIVELEPVAAVRYPPAHNADRNGCGQRPPKWQEQVGGESQDKETAPEDLLFHPISSLRSSTRPDSPDWACGSTVLSASNSDSYRESVSHRPTRNSRAFDRRLAYRDWGASGKAFHPCSHRCGTFPALVSSK